MPGRHRQLRRTGFVVTAAGLSVLVIAGGAWAGYGEFAKRCTTTLHLEVAAAAEIVPAVQTTADAWVKRSEPKVDGACIAVTVTSADPATMAAAVSHQHGVDLVGVPAVGAQQDPAAVDVWVPDSRTWLVRLASEAAGFVPSVLGSIAESPIVLAVPKPSAGALGWPAHTPTVKALAAAVATGKIQHPGSWIRRTTRPA